MTRCKYCGGDVDNDIAREARHRIRGAEKLMDAYATKGKTEIAARVERYINCMASVEDAAEDAKEAWSGYLRAIGVGKEGG